MRRQSIDGGGDFSYPATRYKQSRCCAVVDDFDREAIRRCIYQFYEAKEHVNLTKLPVRKCALTSWSSETWYNFKIRQLHESVHFLQEGGHQCKD